MLNITYLFNCIVSSRKEYFLLNFILLLGSVFKNSCELHIVKHSILDRSFTVHFINIIVSKPAP